MIAGGTHVKTKTWKYALSVDDTMSIAIKMTILYQKNGEKYDTNNNDNGGYYFTTRICDILFNH